MQKVMSKDDNKPKPRGGTELQFDYLTRYVDSKLLDEVQICTPVPEKFFTSYKSKYFMAEKFMTKVIYIIGLKINLIIANMTGMYLIVIGTTNILEITSTYRLTSQ